MTEKARDNPDLTEEQVREEEHKHSLGHRIKCGLCGRLISRKHVLCSDCQKTNSKKIERM